MQDVIDSIVASASDHPPNTGLVVGALMNGRRSVYAFGTAGAGPPNADTLFEIGSVTKLFTTALLSILAAEGRLALDDPAANFAPELAGFPPQITLERLATHTAGLPRMPSNVIGSFLRDPGNPNAAYTTADLLRYLAGRPPSRQAIEAGQVSYSNLGVALLGTLLARRLGQPYEAAIAGHICQPLGMVDTCIRPTAEQARRMAPPHNPRGRPSRNWDLPAFAGAGALKSTADDLLTFLAAHLGDPASAQAAQLQDGLAVRTRAFAPPGLLQRLAARVSGPDLRLDRTQEGVALGWFVGRLASGAADVHWHHGATGGYRSFVGLIRPAHLGVVVLANSGLRLLDGFRGTSAVDRVGFAVLEHLTASG